jgi:hypothetical protein
MKALKLTAVIIVYFFYLPYIVVLLAFEMLRNIILESINYFKNTSI